MTRLYLAVPEGPPAVQCPAPLAFTAAGLSLSLHVFSFSFSFTVRFFHTAFPALFSRTSLNHELKTRDGEQRLLVDADEHSAPMTHLTSRV